MERATVDLKSRVCTYVDNIADRLVAVSRAIHDHPELNFEEHRASRRLCDELGREGFDVELGVGGLDTAIKARHSESLSEGPQVAIFGEYDALPEIGHACGHNLIAAAGLGAALALGHVRDVCPGGLWFFGTPAEEEGSGKIIMLEADIFSHVDVAMMVHPYDKTLVYNRGLALNDIRIEFFGQAAHAAAEPEKGINALNAVLQMFRSIDAMRQHIKDKARIHGIISDGGARANIVPEHAAAVFYVRAPERAYRDELASKVRRCVEGAAAATGCSHTFKIATAVDDMRLNETLVDLFARNLDILGTSYEKKSVDGFCGSTDMGNVSQRIPALHAYMKIGEGIALHTKEFREAAVSDQGHAAMLQAAKGMAMTGIDIFMEPDARDSMKDEFNV